MFQPGDIITVLSSDMGSRLYLARVLRHERLLVHYCVLRTYINGSVQAGSWLYDDPRLCRLALGDALLEDDDAAARG